MIAEIQGLFGSAEDGAEARRRAKEIFRDTGPDEWRVGVVAANMP